jgi:hypothetical protein
MTNSQIESMRAARQQAAAVGQRLACRLLKTRAAQGSADLWGVFAASKTEGVDVNRPAPTIGEQIARRGKRLFVMAITDSLPRMA